MFLRINLSGLLNPHKIKHYFGVFGVILLILSPLTFLPSNTMFGTPLVAVFVDPVTISSSRAQMRQSFTFDILVKANYDVTIGVPVNKSIIGIESPAGLYNTIDEIHITHIYPPFLEYHEQFSLIDQGAAYSYTIEADGISTRFPLLEVKVDIYYNTFPTNPGTAEEDQVVNFIFAPQNLLMVPLGSNLLARDDGFMYAPIYFYAGEYWDNVPTPIPAYPFPMNTALVYAVFAILVIITYLAIILLHKRGVVVWVKPRYNGDPEGLYPNKSEK